MNRLPGQPTATNDQTEELTDAICDLKNEVRVLREAIDELRQEIQWGLRNDLFRGPTPAPHRRVTSVPLDPAAQDWAERVSAVSPQELPPETIAYPRNGSTGVQQELF